MEDSKLADGSGDAPIFPLGTMNHHSSPNSLAAPF
jgi:hypothetical protein